MKNALVKFAVWLVRLVPGKRIDIVMSVLITIAALVLYAYFTTGAWTGAGLSFLQNVEMRSLDARFRLRGPRPVDPRIVIVAIDEKTLQHVGSWPIGRNAYAQLIDRLHDVGARIIALDVTFPTPEKNSAVEALKRLESEVGKNASPATIAKIRQIQASSDNDRILADSMTRAGNVILGHLFLNEERAKSMDERAAEDYFDVIWAKPFPQMQKVSGHDFDLNDAWCKPDRSGSCTNAPVFYGVESNIRILAEAARSYGFFNSLPDQDGTVRRVPLLVRYRDRDFYPSLAFQVVREFEDIKDQDIVGFIAPNGLERVQFGPHSLTTEHDASLLVNYAGPAQTYPHISMADVISGNTRDERFRDAIVLVGATAIAGNDLRTIPFLSENYSGVEIHANEIDNLLHLEQRGRGFLRRGPREEFIDILFILLFGIAFGVIFGLVKPLYSTLSAIAALVLFGLFVYYAFASHGVWLNFVLPVGTLGFNYATITSFRMIKEEREKRRVRKTFERYVSPGVIRLIEREPKKYFRQGGELKELSVMFTDIRSFTQIAEGLTPDELVLLLNEYLGEMTDIVFKRWGTLDKYIGDAMMAFWGSPYPQADHAIRACSAALDMSARLEVLNEQWASEGRKQLRIGIGINTGPVNVGNMGSSRRFAWTVMGDDVNLASRLEGQTKAYQIARIISESTYNQVKDHFVCREIDRIRVKGKQNPVAIFELMDWATNADQHRELVTRFTDAHDAYFRRSWDEAIVKFESLLLHFPDDGPSKTLLDRARVFKSQAPSPEWDGVYVATSK